MPSYIVWYILHLDTNIVRLYNRTKVLIYANEGVQGMEDRIYFCIDQRSFFATVECVARGLDPMKTNLVVADPERSVNTICYL